MNTDLDIFGSTAVAAHTRRDDGFTAVKPSSRRVCAATAVLPNISKSVFIQSPYFLYF